MLHDVVLSSPASRRKMRTSRAVKRWGVLFGLTMLLCGAWGCPNSGLVGSVYHKGDIRYRVGEVESGWRVVRVTENDIAYQHDKYNAIIQINSTCRQDYEDVPLRILTDHLFYGLTHRKVLVQERRRIDARDALYTELTARMDGRPVKAAMLVLKKNRCIYDMSYITVPWNFGLGVGDFYRIIDGFRVLS